MNIVKSIVNTIKDNRSKRLVNIPLTINWPIEKLNKVLVGIQKGRYYLVTGGPKSGKTQIADFLFFYNCIKWYFLHKNKENYPLPKIIYFTFELSIKDKILSIISHMLYKDTGLIRSPEQLLSLFTDYIVEEDVIRKIESYEPILETLNEFITFIDNIKKPSQILKYIENEMLRKGTFKNDFYVPNNQNEITLIVIDHIALIEIENGIERVGINELSHGLIQLRNKYGISPVVIQQQALESEKQQFTNKGDIIISKLKPTSSNLGDSKTTSRDIDVMFGIFSPDKFDIEQYEGYNIGILRGAYKEISVMLNRRGRSNILVDTFFLGAVGHCEALPPPTSQEISKYYNKAKSLEI